MKRLIVLLIVILVIYFIYTSDRNVESFMDFKVQDSDYTVKDIRFDGVREDITESLNLDSIKARLAGTDIFDKMPDDGIFSLEFFDGNGNSLREGVTVYGSGEIKKIIDPRSDFKIITGNYYVSGTQSKDICELYERIKENEDYRFESGISKVKLMWKYRELARYCLL